MTQSSMERRWGLGCPFLWARPGPQGSGVEGRACTAPFGAARAIISLAHARFCRAQDSPQVTVFLSWLHPGCRWERPPGNWTPQWCYPVT